MSSIGEMTTIKVKENVVYVKRVRRNKRLAAGFKYVYGNEKNQSSGFIHIMVWTDVARKEKLNLRHVIKFIRIRHSIFVVSLMIAFDNRNEICNVSFYLAPKHFWYPPFCNQPVWSTMFHWILGHAPLYGRWEAKSAYSKTRLVPETQSSRNAHISFIIPLVDNKDRQAFHQR